MSEATKGLEIFHYATFEEMEEAKRQRARERTLEERFDLALKMMKDGLDQRKAAGIEEDPRAGLIILPPRRKPGADAVAGVGMP